MVDSYAHLIGRSVLLTGTDGEEKREELRLYFHRTFSLYELLFEPLADDAAFYERPDSLRHPLVFYYGHTATFFVNKLILAKAIPQRINPKFEAMFAVGVDEMSWDDLDETHYDWPTIAEVRAYRDQVRDLVDGVIRTMDLSLPVRWNDFVPWTIWMGIEHERIHLETSSVLIRQLDIRWVSAHEAFPICTERGVAPSNQLVPIPGGPVKLGKPRDAAHYGWDNEYGSQVSEVEDFGAAQYLVSNEEYRAFVDAGGYQRPELWTDEGQRWLAYTKSQHPLFWIPDGKSFRFRTMLQEIEMPWNWPVEVNYLEAKAFCNWLAQQTGHNIRLPSEAEWRRLLEVSATPDEPDWPSPAPFNINLEHVASSVPVDRHAAGGLYDPIGNVWQWTETPISGFDGFEVHPLYDDFSTPTFDNKHNLITGGSWISTGNEATRDSRYAFRRHFFQHAGFRYIKGTALPAVADLPNEDYERDVAVSQYCEFHYGPCYFDVPNFPATIVAHVLAAHQGGCERALDLGCAVGRATFELARTFDDVTGVDFSARFIRQAISLQEHGFLQYEITDEGALTTPRTYTLADLALSGLETKVSFRQGDAHNLRPQFADFDLVIAVNLIDRLYNPRTFLSRIHQRIRNGGTLAIASPYTWLETYTEREHWLGGVQTSDGPLTTLDALGSLLGNHFHPISSPIDIPFVIRETARKFQHSITQLTLWRRIPDTRTGDEAGCS